MVINKDASSSDILRWDFSVMGAKSYVLNLSENVRRSLEYKRRHGEWGGKAPLGYLNQRDANNKSTVSHDPERAYLVRMLFEEYAVLRNIVQWVARFRRGGESQKVADHSPVLILSTASRSCDCSLSFRGRQTC
jgi:DNA invertase Pin-like site-specific DNA recombinase